MVWIAPFAHELWLVETQQIAAGAAFKNSHPRMIAEGLIARTRRNHAAASPEEASILKRPTLESKNGIESIHLPILRDTVAHAAS